MAAQNNGETMLQMDRVLFKVRIVTTCGGSGTRTDCRSASSAGAITASSTSVSDDSSMGRPDGGRNTCQNAGASGSFANQPVVRLVASGAPALDIQKKIKPPLQVASM